MVVCSRTVARRAANQCSLAVCNGVPPRSVVTLGARLASCPLQSCGTMHSTKSVTDARRTPGLGRLARHGPQKAGSVPSHLMLGGAAVHPCLFATHTPTVPLLDPLCWAFCDLTWARDGNRKFRQPRQFLIREAHCSHPSIDPISPIDSIETADSGPHNRRAALLCLERSTCTSPPRSSQAPLFCPAAGGWSRHEPIRPTVTSSPAGLKNLDCWPHGKAKDGDSSPRCSGRIVVGTRSQRVID